MIDDDAGLPDVLCCECGCATRPNPTNMCVDCLRSRVDITEGISRQVAQSHCRGCDRYERSGGWVMCERESKELLAILLKRVRGLDKVHLADASFIWTEAHSKRMRVKLTIQREIVAAAVLQASLVVEFVISNKQCDKCARVEAKDYWVSCVQLRQKVPHKRTIFWLEQLMLRHNAHADSTSISEMRDGIDFFHGEKNHSEKLLSFLQTVSPLRYKTSRQMITQDTHTGACRNKYTYSVEVAPICKDDLVCLPADTARTLGNINPLVLCTKVGAHLHFTDPRSLQAVELLPAAYWKRPFGTLCAREHLRDFVVLDVAPIDTRPAQPRPAAKAAPVKRRGGRKGGKRGGGEEASAAASLAGSVCGGKRKGLGSAYAPSRAPSASTRRGPHAQRLLLCEVTVARLSDLGKNDLTFTVRSHLGGVLKAGDRVKGYDLLSRTLDVADAPHMRGGEDGPPPLVLVRKAYASHKPKRRLWRLKALRKELDEDLTAMDVERGKNDYEAFLRDLEEDKAMRAEVNLYANPAALAAAAAAARLAGAPPAGGGHVSGSDEDDYLSDAEVGIEELLDDLSLAQNETFDDRDEPPPPGPAFAPPTAGAFHFT